MRVLTWNAACGRATAAAITLSRTESADVTLLQEAQPAGRWTGSLVGAVVPERAWGSWILARSGALEPIAIPNYVGWVSGAAWWNDQVPTYLFSLHAPTSSARQRRAAYVAESRRIVAEICARVSTSARLVIGGDFNFTSFGERLPSEMIAMQRSELDALAEFRALGFAVAWRDCHAGEPLPQTLRWNGGPSVPYHCDGFLVRGFGEPSISCEVVGVGADLRQSDHNPVVLSISEDGTA